jgi:hypothetical protein
MSFFISDQEWEEYENTVNEFHQDAFQQSIIWKSSITVFNKDGEEVNRYKDNNLKGLIHYNHFRSWPINGQTLTGQIDKQSCMLFLNNKYLNDNGYLDSGGNFNFNPGSDQFLIDNVLYRAKGDSGAAQTKDKNILHFIILQREETETPYKTYGN